jgi:hypothetical protein
MQVGSEPGDPFKVDIMDKVKRNTEAKTLEEKERELIKRIPEASGSRSVT